MSAIPSIGGLGGGHGGGVQQILALRQQIIARNDLLREIHETQAAKQMAQPSPSGAETGGFAVSLQSALNGVSAVQRRSEDLSTAYEKGEVTDVAKVMLARQEAGVAFEATLQVRNKLLSAYQDIMRMGV